MRQCYDIEFDSQQQDTRANDVKRFIRIIEKRSSSTPPYSLDISLMRHSIRVRTSVYRLDERQYAKPIGDVQDKTSCYPSASPLNHRSDKQCPTTVAMLFASLPLERYAERALTLAE